MDALLCKSDFSLARNSSRGRSRNTCATRVSEANSRSGAFSGRGCSDTSIACTTSSSCKARERLTMAALHLRPQILHRSQLQLLYSSFRLPQPQRNFLYAPLFHESLVHHLPLHRWKLPHQPEQLGAMLDGAHLGGLHTEIAGRLWRIVRGRELPRGAFGLIDKSIRRNSQQPRHKWHASPLITRQTGQRLVKHFRRHIFRCAPISRPAGHERIHAFEMQFIQRIKFCWIGLRRLYKQPLVRLPCSGRGPCRRASSRSRRHTSIRVFRRTLPSPSSRGHTRSNNTTVGPEKGYAATSAGNV